MKKTPATLFSILFLAFTLNLQGNMPLLPLGMSAIQAAQVPFPSSTGNLDSTFGASGTVSTAIGPISDVAQAVAMQADGKIVVAGYSYINSFDDIAVIRYNPDGSRDNTFGAGGIVLTSVGPSNDEAFGLAIQNDGKIIVVGQANNGSNTDIAVVRYNTDGSLDVSFDGDGRVTVDVRGGSDAGRSVAIQPDGKIVVAGTGYNGTNNDIVLIRLDTNGSLDTSFNGNSGNGRGIILTPIGSGNDTGYAAALQSDGKIIVAGFYTGPVSTDSVIVRYNTDGVLDATFSGDGIATFAFSPVDVDEALAMALQSDGKIVVTGCIRGNGRLNDYLIGRVNPDGNLDQSFGTGGFTFVPFSTAPDISFGVGIQPDGKIVAAGFANNGVNNDFGVTRVNADGSLDTSFGSEGRRLIAFGDGTDFANAMTIQADGKIVVVGRALVGTTTVFSVARLGYGTNAEGDDGFFDLDTATAIRFDNAYQRGTSSISLVDANAAPALTPGWSFVGSPKVIQTTAQFSGNNVIRFSLPGPIDQTAFNSVRVFQFQNGAWVDRTASSPLRDYATKAIYASVSSLGMLATVYPNSQGAAVASVSGRITSPAGTGLRNVTVVMTDGNNVRRVVLTSSFGYFVFPDVATGQAYTLTIVSRQFRFAARSIFVTEDIMNADFVGLE